ncbi:MAG: phosphoadenylylsulfate reductase [Bacteroidetes bacterium MedPE-SWsnd-G2]|nr:MAG: phosphoadenylylsulfate reductase [Bacteroidetes bacterium MedPE-SWsnd-G2]
MTETNLKELNAYLRKKSPQQIIEWGLEQASRPIVSTSFGKYSAILLHALQSKAPNIDIIWCDTLFNSEETYNHGKGLVAQLKLNIHVYKPNINKTEIEQSIGLPNVIDPEHEIFSEVVKLEPFRRALQEHKPDVWFTNIRVRQTAFRDEKDILSLSKEGILKISPFYYWSDEELERYLKTFKLPKNSNYFDPIKVLEHRECGVHFL